MPSAEEQSPSTQLVYAPKRRRNSRRGAAHSGHPVSPDGRRRPSPPKKETSPSPQARNAPKQSPAGGPSASAKPTLFYLEDTPYLDSPVWSSDDEMDNAQFNRKFRQQRHAKLREAREKELARRLAALGAHPPDGGQTTATTGGGGTAPPPTAAAAQPTPATTTTTNAAAAAASASPSASPAARPTPFNKVSSPPNQQGTTGVSSRNDAGQRTGGANASPRPTAAAAAAVAAPAATNGGAVGRADGRETVNRGQAQAAQGGAGQAPHYYTVPAGTATAAGDRGHHAPARHEGGNTYYVSPFEPNALSLSVPTPKGGAATATNAQPSRRQGEAGAQRAAHTHARATAVAPCVSESSGDWVDAAQVPSYQQSSSDDAVNDFAMDGLEFNPLASWLGASFDNHLAPVASNGSLIDRNMTVIEVDAAAPTIHRSPDHDDHSKESESDVASSSAPRLERHAPLKRKKPGLSASAKPKEVVADCTDLARSSRTIDVNSGSRLSRSPAGWKLTASRDFTSEKEAIVIRPPQVNTNSEPGVASVNQVLTSSMNTNQSALLPRQNSRVTIGSLVGRELHVTEGSSAVRRRPPGSHLSGSRAPHPPAVPPPSQTKSGRRPRKPLLARPSESEEARLFSELQLTAFKQLAGGYEFAYRATGHRPPMDGTNGLSMLYDAAGAEENSALRKGRHHDDRLSYAIAAHSTTSANNGAGVGPTESQKRRLQALTATMQSLSDDCELVKVHPSPQRRKLDAGAEMLRLAASNPKAAQRELLALIQQDSVAVDAEAYNTPLENDGVSSRGASPAVAIRMPVKDGDFTDVLGDLALVTPAPPSAMDDGYGIGGGGVGGRRFIRRGGRGESHLPPTAEAMSVLSDCLKGENPADAQTQQRRSRSPHGRGTVLQLPVPTTCTTRFSNSDLRVTQAFYGKTRTPGRHGEPRRTKLPDPLEMERGFIVEEGKLGFTVVEDRSSVARTNRTTSVMGSSSNRSSKQQQQQAPSTAMMLPRLSPRPPDHEPPQYRGRPRLSPRPQQQAQQQREKEDQQAANRISLPPLNGGAIRNGAVSANAAILSTPHPAPSMKTARF